MVESQKDGKTVIHEKKSEEPPKAQEGRKLHATKFGAKYHFDKFCKGTNGHPSLEK